MDDQQPQESGLAPFDGDLSSNQHHIERNFHDGWANEQLLADVLIIESFEAATALETRFIVSKMGDLNGKKVLDVGCGLGEAAIYFALRGADVTASDLSPKMIQKVQQLAERYGVTVKTLVGPAEELALENESFDFIYSSNLIHHLHDRAAFFRTVSAALKQDGSFYSWDPLTYNPIVWIYRWLAFGVRTPTETPLNRRDLKFIQSQFKHVELHFFWLFGLVIFFKYFLIDRLNPNKVRYWKHVLKETSSSLWWWRPLERMDRFLTKIPIVNLLSWTVVVQGKKHDFR
jgi:SAM-dependent methyltransferase